MLFASPSVMAVERKEEGLFWYHCQGQSGSCSVIRGLGRAITARAKMAGRDDVTVCLRTFHWEKVNDGRDIECPSLDTRQKT